jgi:hypothetical protein
LGSSSARIEWGQVEGIGKGTKASYDSQKKTLTFCFNRGPDTSGEALRKSREALMGEVRELGYVSRMKFNGEVIVDNVGEADVVLLKKNHKLSIRLNKKQDQEKPQSASKLSNAEDDGKSNIKFS